PTSVVHPAVTLRALARTGRILVVDEAFADCVPGEPESLAGVRDVPGVLVVRSLTKTFGLAGLRVGYVLGDAELIAQLARVQPRWAVSAPALEAAVACSGTDALSDAAAWASRLSSARAFLIDRLSAIPGVDVVPEAAASFVLVRTPASAVWIDLATRGFAVRRGDTFPGLGAEWIRVAVRDQSISAAFADALEECL
ncbi:MAG TPA: aminotransferase class I/II-fold pyridoxal phosphate-dependent enzyme, partial [Jatrophihabitantaceae bacterium]|nr:aminotransferase class I/II-fold pyridoxal phosphate-dependent enzyme [Jatrophihabitantaceae bacterium]